MAQGLNYAAPVLTGGASLPVQALVQGGAAAADTALQGGTGKQAAISGAIGAAIPPAATGLGALLGGASGSALKQSAGKLFRVVDEAAANSNVVIDTSKPGNAALEIFQNKQAGGELPQGIRRFVERATDPTKPMSYQEARQFYSNLNRLSVKELTGLGDNTKRLLSNFVSALDDSIREAVEPIGQGENYAKAMQEYARGAQRSKLFEKVIKKYVVPAAVTGIAGGLGFKAGAKAGEKILDLGSLLAGGQ